MHLVGGEKVWGGAKPFVHPILLSMQVTDYAETELLIHWAVHRDKTLPSYCEKVRLPKRKVSQHFAKILLESKMPTPSFRCKLPSKEAGNKVPDPRLCSQLTIFPLPQLVILKLSFRFFCSYCARQWYHPFLKVS